jgi:hypothetical protein
VSQLLTRSNPNKHLNKIRTRCAEERNRGFSCSCLRKECFSCTWRSNE